MAVFMFLFLGCAYTKEELTTLVKDPHYAKHQGQLDELEKSYLDKKITYAEYLEKKKQLEENYDKEVKERENIIHNENTVPAEQEL